MTIPQLKYDLKDVESMLLRDSDTNTLLLDRYVGLLTQYALTRSDYLSGPLIMDCYPELMKKYCSECNISKKIIQEFVLRVGELSDFLRIHDILDFSCYLAQVVYQTTGDLEEYLSTNSLMIHLAENARYRCFELVKMFGGSKLLELIEPVIDTIEGLFTELNSQLVNAFSDSSDNHRKHCAVKINAKSEPKYLQLIDDVFDFAITGSNNFENNSPLFIKKRNELIT